MKFIRSILDRIITVVCAVFLAQAPVYMHQYTQVLAGAHQESEATYLELEARAAKYNQPVLQFLTELKENDDPKVRDNADVSLNTVERYLDYDKALKSLEGSHFLLKPFNFIRHFDRRIQAALDFKPGLPFSIEGIVYGILGIFLAMGLNGIFKRLFGTKRKSPQEPLAETEEI